MDILASFYSFIQYILISGKQISPVVNVSGPLSKNIGHCKVTHLNNIIIVVNNIIMFLCG